MMKRPAAQMGAMGERGEIEPRDVLHLSASLANKMVMLGQVRIEPHGVALHHCLADQTGRRHGMQALVYRGQGRTRIGPVDGLISLLRGGVRRAADFPVTKGGEKFRP